MKLRRSQSGVAAPGVLQLVARLDRDEPGEATLDVARALMAGGWRALVATGGGPLERELRIAGAVFARVPLEVGGPLRQWQTARTLARLARTERAAVIHARSPETAVLAAELGRRLRLPFVVTAHALPEPAGRRDAAYRAALQAAGRVLASSEFAAEHLTGPVGLAAERVAVVPRWIDLDELDPDRVRGHRVAAAAERCGLSLGPRVVGAPVDVATSDGRELLLAALSRLAHHDFLLLLMGPPPDAKGGLAKLTTGLRAAGLEERVRYATDLADLPAILAALDVLVVPATRPYPVSRLAVAAQAMGKPVIVTGMGGLAETVMPAVTGWLLPPEDPGEIAWALDLALQMEEGVRERVARRAREFVAATFGIRSVLGRQLAIYAELAGRTPAPALVAPAAAE